MERLMKKRLASLALVVLMLFASRELIAAYIVADNVRETSVTTGTGALALAGAVSGYVTFAAKMADGDTCYYSIRNRDVPTEWEVGAGTYNTGPVLTRTYVTASSNAGAATSFSAGTKDVWISSVAYRDARIPAYFMVRNVSTSDQLVSATTAYLSGSGILMPNIALQPSMAVGARFTWRMTVVKTAAGTAATTFFIQLGTTGTTSDADIITLALPVGTGVVDTGYIEITAVVRGPLGASCIVTGTLAMKHNLATTGLINLSTVVVFGLSGSVTSSTANLNMSLAVTTGASQAWTFRQLSADGEFL